MKKSEASKSRLKKLARNPKIGYIGGVILATVAGVGIMSVAVMFPGVAHIIAPFVQKKKYSKKQVIQRNVASLIRSGVLKRSINAQGEEVLEITHKGKWEALIRFGSQDTRKEVWDSMWRVVVFDIPSRKNDIRVALRRAMKMYGFVMLQQSVWVYPYACDDFVALLKDHLGVSNDVLYMKVATIENDRALRKEFSLQ